MSFIKYGNASVSGISYGSTPVRAVYYGSQWVWGITVPIGTENLELSPSGTVHFNAAGQSKNITVTSHDTWYVTKDSSWISLNKNSGTNGQSCLISCAENTDFSPRTGTVTFTCGTRRETITVYQAGVERVITVSPSSVENVPTSGGTYQFNITSNCDWDISSSGWITVSGALTGTGNRANVQFTVANNTGGPRTGYIWVADDEGAAETGIITITQNGVTVQPSVEARAINWHDETNDTWLNKQSWQVKFKGGSTTRTINNINLSVVDDSGNTKHVISVPSSSLTLSPNETICWGLNDSDFYDSNKAQLSLNGYDLDYDECVLAVYSDLVSDEVPFVQREV